MTLFALVILSSVSAKAEEEEPLLLVTGNDYSPFSGHDLPQGGFTTELVTAAFDKAGIATSVRFLPWKRGYLMAKDHEALGTFPYVRDAQREADFLFSDTLLDVTVKFFLTAEQAFFYEDAASLEDNVLCRPLGYTLEPIKTKILTDESHLWQPRSLTKCFELLLAGRIYAVPISEPVGWATIKEAGWRSEQFRLYPLALAHNSHHLIIARDYPNALQVLNQFNSALAELRKNGDYDQILRKHLPDMASLVD